MQVIIAPTWDPAPRRILDPRPRYPNFPPPPMPLVLPGADDGAEFEWCGYCGELGCDHSDLRFRGA